MPTQQPRCTARLSEYCVASSPRGFSLPCVRMFVYIYSVCVTEYLSPSLSQCLLPSSLSIAWPLLNHFSFFPHVPVSQLLCLPLPPLLPSSTQSLIPFLPGSPLPPSLPPSFPPSLPPSPSHTPCLPICLLRSLPLNHSPSLTHLLPTTLVPYIPPSFPSLFLFPPPRPPSTYLPRLLVFPPHRPSTSTPSHLRVSQSPRLSS